MIQISPEQVARYLPMTDCIDSMEELFRNEAESISSQPNRAITRVDDDSVIITMPGYSEKLGRFAVKVVSEYRRNPDRFGMKAQGGIILLFDSTSSELLAMIDSPRLTAIRTGAVSALATRLLSRKNAERVGLIGSGDQARTILEGIDSVRKVSEAFVFSRDYSHAKSFSKEMSARLGLPVLPLRSLSELREKVCDVLVLATNSSSPVLKWEDDTALGMHINSIGTLPDRMELDLQTVLKSRVFVDTKIGVLSEAGDIMSAIRSGLIDETHIVGDLSDVLNGRKEGRRTESEITLFKSVGFSLQDVYASARLYENISMHR